MPAAPAGGAHAAKLRAVHSQFLRNLVGVGATMSLTLTFLHAALWAPVLACVALGTLTLIVHMVDARSTEPPAFFAAAAWIAAILVLASASAVAQGFYNVSQIAYLLFGLVIGYVISTTRTPEWAAWLPFSLFAALFLAILAAGGDPGDVMTRNSRNFVSVIMLALYTSAVVMSKPRRVGRIHVVAALVTLVIAVAATGRGGIVTALALNVGLLVNVVLRGRMTFLRSLGTIVGIVVAAVVVYVAAGALLSQGLFGRLAERGLQDAPRLAMILAYFNGIEPIELVLGRNYYDDPFLAQWEFNLHNSYLSAWAHLTVLYLALILATLALAAMRQRASPGIAIAVGAFALRALTVTQRLAGKYDYLVVAALCAASSSRRSST